MTTGVDPDHGTSRRSVEVPVVMAVDAVLDMLASLDDLIADRRHRRS